MNRQASGLSAQLRIARAAGTYPLLCDLMENALSRDRVASVTIHGYFKILSSENPSLFHQRTSLVSGFDGYRLLDMLINFTRRIGRSAT